jgi:putative transposase
VLSWRLSNSLETHFCVEALEHALADRTPEIFNSDQGAQFTSLEFTGRLLEKGVRISMDGRGRALDNVFVERLWRSVKWEEVYVNSYQSVHDAWHGLHRYFTFYNHERPHQALGYRTPAEVYGLQHAVSF